MGRSCLVGCPNAHLVSFVRWIVKMESGSPDAREPLAAPWGVDSRVSSARMADVGEGKEELEEELFEAPKKCW